MTFVDVVREEINPNEVLGLVGSEEDGANILFVGRVRNHNEGLSVQGVRYEAYEDMAKRVLAEIVLEAAGEFGTDRIASVHRIGDLIIGEISLVVAVSSHHRKEAFAASRYIIEEIKKRLPVWKRECYLDGNKSWIEGASQVLQSSDRNDVMR